MNTRELHSTLNAIVINDIKNALMLWGPPGIAKSATIANVAAKHSLELIDLRISQITPSDLRGLPAADVPNKSFEYLPPSFLPRADRPKGILFLDEITQAPPAVQAITQQLILDRRVGSLVIPDGWFIWAAGNRQSDKTAVYSMPSALANRFVHFDIAPDFETWKLDYALEHVHADIISFLSMRPELLHKMLDTPAWPSPRSWTIANNFYKVGLDISGAVGASTAAEFKAFLATYKNLPDLDKIFAGKGSKIEWPVEESAQYATTIGIQQRCITADADSLYNALEWMAEKSKPEYGIRLLHELIRMGERVPNMYKVLSQLNKGKVLEFVKKAQRLSQYA